MKGNKPSSKSGKGDWESTLREHSRDPNKVENNDVIVELGKMLLSEHERTRKEVATGQEMERLQQKVDQLETENEFLQNILNEQTSKQPGVHQSIFSNVEDSSSESLQRIKPNVKTMGGVDNDVSSELARTLHAPITLGAGIAAGILGILLITSEPLVSPILLGLSVFSFVTFRLLQKRHGFSIKSII